MCTNIWLWPHSLHVSVSLSKYFISGHILQVVSFTVRKCSSGQGTHRVFSEPVWWYVADTGCTNYFFSRNYLGSSDMPGSYYSRLCCFGTPCFQAKFRFEQPLVIRFLFSVYKSDRDSGSTFLFLLQKASKCGMSDNFRRHRETNLEYKLLVRVCCKTCILFPSERTE